MEDPPTLWREGETRLLDYGPSEGSPLIVVPSLVNRAYVLDLLPDHSMLRYLSAHGTRPLLLDWGYPGAAEKNFSLSDYIAGRLERAVAFVVTQNGGAPVTLAGYCMGGLMAVALAHRQPQWIARLALLATPWDFWAPAQHPSPQLASILPLLEPTLAATGTLPVDVLQLAFSLLAPGSVASKYRDFATQDQGSARARTFVAIEDWLNDGVPLAAQVAREALAGWYGTNSPASGSWHVLGIPVRPDHLRMPAFVAAPRKDRIVPLESAKALAEALCAVHLHIPAAGHIGMVAGSNAERALWQPFLSWLNS